MCSHLGQQDMLPNDDEVMKGKGLNQVPSLQEPFSSLHVLRILFFV